MKKDPPNPTPAEELPLSPTKEDPPNPFLDEFVTSPVAAARPAPGKTRDNAEEPGPWLRMLTPLEAVIFSMSHSWACNRKVPQHGSSSFYMHRAAQLTDRKGSGNRKGSTKRPCTMLSVLAATIFMPGVAAVETYGGITDFVTSARERWCNMHVALHVVATILTGICLFKSVIFAIGEIKAGWAELSEALQEARQAKHAAARTQSRTAPRARLQSVKYMN